MTEAQQITRADLAASDATISASKHTKEHILRMESLGHVLRTQDDTFVHICIEIDGSYPTTLLDRD